MPSDPDDRDEQADASPPGRGSGRSDGTPPPGRGPGRSDGTASNLRALSGVGVELGLVVAVLTLGGWWLDGKWGTGPWLMISGALVGIVGGMYKLIRQSKRFFDKPSNTNKHNR